MTQLDLSSSSGGFDIRDHKPIMGLGAGRAGVSRTKLRFTPTCTKPDLMTSLIEFLFIR